MDGDDDTNYPTHDELDPEQAKFLYSQRCAILIVEDLPVGSEFGIDLMTVRIGDKFRGVKLIPPGIHFIYANAIDNRNQNHGPRVGFVHNFKSLEILVKRWSSRDEDFDDSYLPSEDHLDRYKSSLKELDRFLGPYQFSTYRTYLNLTGELTSDILAKILPETGRLRSVPYLVRQPSTYKPSTRRIRSLDAELLPDLKQEECHQIRFTSFDTNRSLDPKLLTQYHLDKTSQLDQLFPDDSGRKALIAELQFAFISFLLYHIYDCFEQWKRLICLICMSDIGLRSYPELYRNFMKTISCQILQVPEDLFEGIVDSNNFVRHQLDTLFQNIKESPTGDDDLKEHALRLQSKLEEKYGWIFGLELDEDLPVVVDTA